MPIAAVYISEIAKAHKRGRFVILYECVFTFGLFVSGFIGSFIVPRFGWQTMFFIGTAPILIALSLRSMLPESPRWLASRNRLSEATSAIDRIEQEIEKSSGSKLPAPTEWVPADTKRASWRDIVGPNYLRRSIVVWIIWFATFFITYGLGTWLPTLYRTVFNLPLETALRYGTIGSLMQLVGGITAGFVIDRLGRRRLFMIAFFGAATALLALWFVGLDSVTQFVICSGIAYYFRRIGGARRVSLHSGNLSDAGACLRNGARNGMVAFGLDAGAAGHRLLCGGRNSERLFDFRQRSACRRRRRHTVRDRDRQPPAGGDFSVGDNRASLAGESARQFL